MKQIFVILLSMLCLSCNSQNKEKIQPAAKETRTIDKEEIRDAT